MPISSVALPAPAVTNPSGSPAPSAAGKGEVQVPPNSFTRAALEHVEPFFDSGAVVMPASAPFPIGPIDIPAYGFLRHILVLVEATGGVGGAATVVKQEDAPWRGIQDVLLADTGGNALNGLVDGYDLLLQNRWGAYAFETDPEQSPSYSDVAVGAGATGNFTVLLRIPVEITGRNGYGALPNMHAANAYKLSFSIAPSSRVYLTAPATTLPNVRVRCFLEGWSVPAPADVRGVPNTMVPPDMGTTQYWSSSIHNLNAGEQRIRLPRIGNLIRNLVAIFRTNAANTPRSTVDMPDPLRIEWDGNIVSNLPRSVQRHYMREQYTQPFDGFDTGILAFQFTNDLDYKPGDEMRDKYWATTPASRIELVGNFGVAGTLKVLTNDVAPKVDIPVGV